jgi:hypothetical protein
MADESKGVQGRYVKTVFHGDESLPTHYVNSVNIRSTPEEFFLTFGTVTPLDITDIQQLEDIESISAHPLFRCAISRTVMKQLIDLMTNIYENQTKQIEVFQASQRKDDDYGVNDSRSSIS